jgi:predicted tellurium resistance membrane protein TerC
MDWITEPASWVAFGTLLLLEIVLGIDNIVFISILAGKLPKGEQAKARRTGLGLAIGTRLLLLMSLAYVVKLTATLISPFGHDLSGRDLILVAGGLFLIGKSTHEIHQKLEGEEGVASTRTRASFASVVAQILVLDIVFSLDSVITAVGMVDRLEIMIAAVLVATLIMMFAAGTISTFVDRHPTLKILALSFLLLIGFTLLIEGFERHVPKGYVYAAMAFSVFVEALNIRMRKKTTTEAVKLHEPYTPGASPAPSESEE